MMNSKKSNFIVINIIIEQHIGLKALTLDVAYMLRISSNWRMQGLLQAQSNNKIIFALALYDQ